MVAIKYSTWELLKYHSDESSVQIRIEQQIHKLGVNEGFVTVVLSNLKGIKYKECNMRSVRHAGYVQVGNTQQSNRSLKLEHCGSPNIAKKSS